LLFSIIFVFVVLVTSPVASVSAWLVDSSERLLSCAQHYAARCCTFKESL